MIKIVRVLLALILLTPAFWGIWQVQRLKAKSSVAIPSPEETTYPLPSEQVSKTPLPSAGGALKVSLPSPTVKPSQTKGNRPIIMKDDEGDGEKENEWEDEKD